MRFRDLLTMACLALCLCAAPQARADALADDEAALERAKTRFHSGQYEEAVAGFEALFAGDVPASDPKRAQREELRRAARPYYIASLVGLGQTDRADEQVLQHLMDNPFYELPPGFPSAVQDRFIEVRRTHYREIEKRKREIMRDRQVDVERLDAIRRRKEARIAELERLAAEEKSVIRRSRLVAAIPFGVGQFQNGDTGLGVLFLGLGVASIGGHVVTGAVFQYNVRDFLRECQGELPREQLDPEQPADCEASETQLDALAIANWATLGSAFAVAVAGVIEAQVNFVPESITVKKRPIPPPVEAPPVTVEPVGGATDTGFYFGLRGRF